MIENGKRIKRVAIYGRCSTTETRQDVELQLAELRRFCQAQGWAYDVVSEYDSGYKGRQEKLREVLRHIQHGRYQALIVFSLDRFSREHPSKVNALLDTIVQRDGCRFISKQEGIDSDQEMVWHCIKPLFSYFAFVYSRNLSEKIKLGIKTKKEKGAYTGGRPAKQIDVARLKMIWEAYPYLGWRLKTERFNEGLDTKHQVSVSLFRKVCKKLSFGHESGHGVRVLEIAQNSR